MERDGVDNYVKKIMDISTHTLTWSVTTPTRQNVQIYLISTHTLTWSVTLYVALVFSIRFISTHTLTWSVTPVAYLGSIIW